MSKNLNIINSIFYHILLDHFTYSNDWVEFAEWLDVYKIEVPKREVLEELVTEILYHLPNKNKLTFEGLGRLTEICSLIDRHLSTEEQENFLYFLKEKRKEENKENDRRNV